MTFLDWVAAVFLATVVFLILVMVSLALAAL